MGNLGAIELLWYKQVNLPLLVNFMFAPSYLHQETDGLNQTTLDPINQ